MADNILEVSASLTLWGDVEGNRDCGATLVDFKTAFPSLAHSWIFWVLSVMGLPSYIVHRIRALYNNIRTSIVYSGAVFLGFTVLSGIKQGCPMSGSIFALALDPVVRRMSARLPRPLSFIK